MTEQWTPADCVAALTYLKDVTCQRCGIDAGEYKTTLHSLCKLCRAHRAEELGKTAGAEAAERFYNSFKEEPLSAFKRHLFSGIKRWYAAELDSQRK